MLPSDPKQILEFLRFFRGEEKMGEPPQGSHRIKRTAVFEEWKTVRKSKGRRTLTMESFHTLLNGDAKRPTYEDIMDLISAHGFKCIDLFIDFLVNCRVEDIVVVTTAMRGPKKLSDESTILRVDETYLNEQRTKIEYVTIEPGGKTEKHFHTGHEFVLVEGGSVVVRFEDRYGGTAEKHLNEGDSVAFSSLIKHEFENVGPTKVRLLSARPAKSKPKDEASLDWYYAPNHQPCNDRGNSV